MLAIIWKDVLLELRTRETTFSILLLGILVLLVFRFALGPEPAAAPDTAPGLLWAAIVFSAMLGMGRTFAMEREQGGLEALLMAPIDRGSIFLAKLAVNVLFLVVFEAVLLPAFALFFPVEFDGRLGNLAAVMLAGTVGLAATGTLFALVAQGTRARELMLPLLVLPLDVPLLLACVEATALVLAGEPLTALGSWGNLLVGFDILFVTGGWLTFEFVAAD